jgi:hypothetical protein
VGALGFILGEVAAGVAGRWNTQFCCHSGSLGRGYANSNAGADQMEMSGRIGRGTSGEWANH